MTSIPRVSGRATSATLVDPVSTVTMSVDAVARRGLDGRHREPVALLEPGRDVRAPRRCPRRRNASTSWARPGQPVGIEVPEHHDPLARPARPVDPCHERSRVGQQPRVVEPRDRRREERVERLASATPRRASTVAANVPSPCSRAAARYSGVEPHRVREDPAVTGVDHRREDAMSGSPRRLVHAGCGRHVGRVARVPVAWRGWASAVRRRAVGPPTGATRRAAGSR